MPELELPARLRTATGPELLRLAPAAADELDRLRKALERISRPGTGYRRWETSYAANVLKGGAP